MLRVEACPIANVAGTAAHAESNKTAKVNTIAILFMLLKFDCLTILNEI
jgi:hypothetical protein